MQILRRFRFIDVGLVRLYGISTFEKGSVGAFVSTGSYYCMPGSHSTSLSRIAVFAVGGLSDGIALSVSCRSFVGTAKSNCGL